MIPFIKAYKLYKYWILKLVTHFPKTIKLGLIYLGVAWVCSNIVMLCWYDIIIIIVVFGRKQRFLYPELVGIIFFIPIYLPFKFKVVKKPVRSSYCSTTQYKINQEFERKWRTEVFQWGTQYLKTRFPGSLCAKKINCF